MLQSSDDGTNDAGEQCLPCEKGDWTLDFFCCRPCGSAGEAARNEDWKFGTPGAEQRCAELETKAAAEAEQLLGADGLVCLERLKVLRGLANTHFVSRVLSRLPFSTAVELPHDHWDADAFNTATLLDDFREMRQWQEAGADVTNIFPARLLSFFEDSERTWRHLRDAEFLAPAKFRSLHPTIKPTEFFSGSSTWEKQPSTSLISASQFRSLLRTFTGGLLEGLEIHPGKLVVGGSALAWCVRKINAEQVAMCAAEQRATALQAAVFDKLSTQLNAALAGKILHMAFGHGEKPQPTSKSTRGRKGRAGADERPSAADAQAIRRKLYEELSNEHWADADIDLFIIGGSNTEEAEETARRAVRTIERTIVRATGGRAPAILQTKNTLTVSGGWPLRNVQVVLKTMRSSQELLVHSDVDCSAMAYDGRELWVTTRALRAVVTGYNFVPKQVVNWRGHGANRTVARFNKYLRRGFGILVFEHCRHFPRCDHEVDAAGLKRLKEIKVPKELDVSKHASPQQKGKALAKWMSERIMPPREEREARRAAKLAKASAEGDDQQEVQEGPKPGDWFRKHYQCWVDIVIPSGPGVCRDTMREYLTGLGRPDLLSEVSLADVKVEPKSRSDRQNWQERLTGKCYICKEEAGSRGKWPVCAKCAAFNKAKREEKADVTGMVAVVTGARTKIGYECALRLLRSGATVVATSRFPRVAVEKYSAEADYETFRGRLMVLQADFRRLGSVQQLVETIIGQFDRIDILIHNAAQTIRRPPAYFESLIRKEAQLAELADGAVPAPPATGSGQQLVDQALALLPVDIPLAMPLLPSDHEADLRKAELFPAGRTDAHGEQLDLRTATTWTQTIEDTEMPELVEVLSVNLVVPYVLTARLLPLLRGGSSFVVFVSSMEGQFSQPTKNSTHPHTNIAKAGLNMLAKTIGGHLRRDSIFVSAVDPGWVSWMQPEGPKPSLPAPLTEADGAARVLDAVFGGMRALRGGRCPPTGVLFKDFRIAAW